MSKNANFDISAYMNESSFDMVCSKIKGALAFKLVMNWIISPIYVLMSFILLTYLEGELADWGELVILVLLIVGSLIKYGIFSLFVTPKVAMFKDYYVRRALELHTDLKLYCHREEDFSVRANDKDINIPALALMLGMPSGTTNAISNDYFSIKRSNLNVHIMNLCGKMSNNVIFEGFSYIVELPKKLLGRRIVITPKALITNYKQVPELEILPIFADMTFKKKFITSYPTAGQEEISFSELLGFIRLWEEFEQDKYGFNKLENTLDEADSEDVNRSSLETMECYDISQLFTQELAQILLELRKHHNYVSLCVENNVLVLSVSLKKDQFEPRYGYGFKNKDIIIDCVDAEVQETLSFIDPLLQHVNCVFPVIE